MATMARERISVKEQNRAKATGKLPRRKSGVDKLLEETPTVEEHYRSNLSTGRKKKGQDDDDDSSATPSEDSEGADEEEENRIPPSKPTKSPSKPTKSPALGRKPSKKGQNSGATGKNQNRGKRQDTILTSDDEENGPIPTSKRPPSPVRGRKISPKGKNSDRTSQKHRKNDSQNSVQSISSTSTSNGFRDIQEEKEVRRVQDANRWVNETQSNKIILAYKDRVKQMQDSSHQKNLLIDELQVELTNLQQKFGLLENDNERVRAALQHVRNHPEELVRQITKKKSAKKTIKKKRSVDSIDTYGGGGDTEDPNVVSGMIATGKDTVKIVYRTFKFINNDNQQKMYHELMLNNLGDAELIFLPNDSDERKAKVEEKRKLTVEEYGSLWVSQLNVHRTYVQTQTRKVILEWMQQNHLDELPPITTFTDMIATRDFSDFDIEEDDTEDLKKVKKTGLEGMEQLMDLYTDKLVPCVAGPTLFHPKIRHFEPMTTAKMPPVAGLDQLRIPASTEAMTILIYINNRKKWQSMIAWKKKHPGNPFPRYSSKHKDKNKEFKEEYSHCSGKTNDWGGWSYEGRKLFNQLQKKIHDSRIKNLDRHVRVDKECVARLYGTYKDMHGDMAPPAKKQKQDGPEIDPNEDEEMNFIVEL